MQPEAATPDPASVPQRRRRLFFAGVGMAAGLGGAGLAAWKLSLKEQSPQAQQDFWAAEFAGLDQRMVAMESFQGKPLLLNFWATWCPPCVQELPLLNQFYTQQQGAGWQVLGLAIDQADKVQAFVQRMPLRFPVLLGGAQGLELVRQLGNERGGLPFSLLFAANGSILTRKMGKLSEQDLHAWAALA